MNFIAEEEVLSEGVVLPDEKSTAIDGEVLLAPTIRDWDVYAYGEAGVEIVRPRETWEPDQIGTLILDRGKMWESSAVPMDFAGRRLVGIAPFGADTPHSVTITVPYTQLVRLTFNTEKIPGLGGPNVFICQQERLNNCYGNLPFYVRAKRIFSPLIEAIVEHAIDRDRDLYLTAALWTQMESCTYDNIAVPRRNRSLKATSASRLKIR